MTDIRAQVETISPKRAGVILATSKGNRNISDTYVESLSKLMEDGLWEPRTGSAIGFDKDGSLVKGHHRLYAVIKSKVSLKTLVVYGLDRDAVMQYEGKGKPWTLANSLEFAGVPNASQVASVATLALICATSGSGKVPVRGNLPHAGLMVDWALDNAPSLDAATKVARNVYVKGMLNVSEAGTLYFLMPNALKAETEEYLEKVARPDLSVNSIETQVYKRLLKFRSMPGQLRQHTALAWLLDGFNAKIEDKKKPRFWREGSANDIYPTWPKARVARKAA